MAEQAEPAGIAASISDALSFLHIRHYGKAPSAVQTFLFDLYAFCVLKDPYTTVEQTLIERGKRWEVRNRRQRFENAMVGTYEQTVADITGRKVVAFMGQTHVGPDLAVEMFSFEGAGLVPEQSGDQTTAIANHAPEISEAVALLHSRYYSKGPTEAETFLQDGYAFCVLTDPFTTVEQTLIEVGRQSDVRDIRQAFQDAMSTRFRQAVEGVTGRKIVAFMSQTHVGPDLAIEMFKFEEPADQTQSLSSDAG